MNSDRIIKLTRPGKSEAEAEVETEARDVVWIVKNTVYERLRSNIKFINTKKSHPVRQSQQCQCTIQKFKQLATISYQRRT